MFSSTLCYLERDGQYLMLHRIKKDKDINRDKWIGVGGHIEPGEEPDACIRREVLEETGLTLTNLFPRGVILFENTKCEQETIYLYTATQWTGELCQCSEGELEWIDKKAVSSLCVWEGDKIFLRLMEAGADFFHLKLSYDGDRLVGAVLNSETII